MWGRERGNEGGRGEGGEEGDESSLSTIVTLVNVGVDVNVGDVAVEDGSGGLNHAVGDLRADANGVTREDEQNRSYWGDGRRTPPLVSS